MSPIISSPQSVQTQAIQTGISGVAASNTTYTSGTISVTGVGGGVTVSSNTGQRIDISVAAQSVQVVQSALAASNTTYTSGLVTITGVGGGVTVSSNTGQRIDISVAAPVAQTAQTGISGVAASNTTYTSGTISITGVGGGVTVSSNTGQRVDISVAAQSVQTQNLHNVTISGNTSGALAAISSGTMTLAGGNNVTLSQAGNAVTISAAAQSVQVVQSAIAASNTTYTSGVVSFTGVGGGVTVSSNTGQRVDISVAAQSVQTQNLVDVTLSGNTSGALALVSSGTLTLAGGNNITLSQAGNAVTISAANAGGAQTGISSIAASNTTYTSGQVEFTGSQRVTIRSSANQRVVVDGVWHDVTLSGNSTSAGAGYILVSTGTLALAGGPNITLSQNGNTISISGGAGAGGFSAGVSTGGNTAGATGVSGTRVVLVGTLGVSLSQTTDANGATITINASQESAIAAAASDTTFTSGTVVWSVSDGSRSALSFSSGAQTILLTDFGPKLAWWANGAPAVDRQSNRMSLGTNLTLFPLKPGHGNRFDGRMTASIFQLMASFVQSATASISAVIASTMNVYIYTRSSDSLSLLNSGSMSFGNTAAATNNSTGWHGARLLAITATSAWSSRPDFVYGGEYYVGVRMNTNVTTGLSGNQWVQVLPNTTVWASNLAPVQVAGSASAGLQPFLGIISLTASNQVRTTIARSEVSGFASGANNGGPELPYLIMYESTFLS